MSSMPRRPCRCWLRYLALAAATRTPLGLVVGRGRLHGSVGASRVVPVTDEREWRDHVHVGRRLMREGHVNPPEAPHG